MINILVLITCWVPMRRHINDNHSLLRLYTNIKYTKLQYTFNLLSAFWIVFKIYLLINHTISKNNFGLSSCISGLAILISPKGWVTSLFVDILTPFLLLSVFSWINYCLLYHFIWFYWGMRLVRWIILDVLLWHESFWGWSSVGLVCWLLLRWL